MGHIVLLGDSIFDNGVYVPGEADVVRQLEAVLPAGWRATLLAVDGGITRSLASQLSRLPTEATHLVVSVGGNDALSSVGVLGAAVRNVEEALAMLARIQAQFQEDYLEMLRAVLEVRLPAALCTIYDTRIMDPDPAVIKAALALFNDCITRAAFSRGLPLIDLRLICSDDDDYANPIEPSAKGGAKIASAIAALVATAGWGGHSTVISGSGT